MASVLNDLGVGNQGITREKFMRLSCTRMVDRHNLPDKPNMYAFLDFLKAARSRSEVSDSMYACCFGDCFQRSLTGMISDDPRLRGRVCTGLRGTC